MKLHFFLLAIGFIASLALSAMAADAKAENQGTLRHVVAFKFKDGTTKEQIMQVENAFRDLKKKVTEIGSYEWGINNSPENLNKGCTHGFILGFKSEKDRDAYLVHPAHKEFGKLVKPLLDDVFVIDFWAKN